MPRKMELLDDAIGGCASRGWFCVLVGVVAGASCGGKKPPVARAVPPPPPPRRAPTRAGRRRRRSRSPSRPSCRPSRCATTRISSASLDDLNRSSPLKPVFFEYDSSEIAGDAQAVLDENAGGAEAVRHLGGDDRRSLRRTRHRRVQSGIGRTARGRRARLSGVARHVRPIGCGRSATARSFRSIRVTTRRRSRKTAARISSSPRSRRVIASLLKDADRS